MILPTTRQGTHEGLGVADEGLRHVVSLLVHELVGELLGDLGHVSELGQEGIHQIVLAVADAVDGDGPVDVPHHGVAHGGLSDHARLLGVCLAADAHEGALGVAEGIGADAGALEGRCCFRPATM